jgi:NAD+ synthase (glutamine-hydrolysing)
MELRVGLGQLNASVGDISGNVEIMHRFYKQAQELGVEVLIFPEMAVCGYPPEDLLLKKHFFEENLRGVERLARDCPRNVIVVGFAESAEMGYFNSLAMLEKGEIKRIYRKCILPNYGVFDERRYFRAGSGSVIVKINGMAVVFTICEDILKLEWMDKLLKEITIKDIIINISASPFHVGNLGQRHKILSHCAEYFDSSVVYCNLVGGQDELVFDGRSMFLDSTGTIVSQAKAFAEDLLVADIFRTDSRKVEVKQVKRTNAENIAWEPADPVVEVHAALVLGTRDYVLKNGFKKVIIGLSGGIDSSVTAAIAVNALGNENVVGITMPSKFNSPQTISDAERIAKNLGIEFWTIPISGIVDQFDKTLTPIEGWTADSIAHENLQARIRGTILMALSNRFYYLVLTTGNKSETAVGYSTLYGDTAGGFAVLKDVPKTMVYRLAEHINELHQKQVIPQSIIERPPSAELKENQKDTDSLPEYDLLDKIIKGYIEEDKSGQELIRQGLPEDVVTRIIRMIDLNEYKRRQSPPGVKITPKAFGKDRRMPITNLYVSDKAVGRVYSSTCNKSETNNAPTQGHS